MAGFSIGQDAIVGIEPSDGTSPGTDTEKTGLMWVYDLTNSGASSFTRSSSADDFTGLSFKTSVYSATSDKNSFSFGLGLYQDDVLRSVICSAEVDSLPAGYGYSDYPFSDISFGKDIEDGTYQIRSISKLLSDTNWLPDRGSASQYIDALVNGNTLTLSMPGSGLHVNSITVEGNNNVGDNQKVTVSITNNGGDFSGPLYLCNGNKALDGDGIAIHAGATEIAQYSFIPKSSGTYTLKMCRDDQGAEVVDGETKSITIEDVTGTSSTKDLGLTFKVKNIQSYDGNYIYGKKMKFTLSVTNPSLTDSYKNNVILEMLTDTEVAAYYQIQAVLSSNSTKDYDVEMDLPDYGYYSLYAFYYYDSSKYNYSFVNTYNFTRGLGIWKEDGTNSCSSCDADITIPSDAVAVDMQGLGISSVVPNANPNTLYYVDDSSEMPSGLDGKNIVKGSTAASISLTDGYSFFAPYDFTATAISYTRSFASDNSQKKVWQTIALPFSPTSIVANGRTIDWFHSKEDSGKDFYLYDFSYEDANLEDGKVTTYFGHTDSFKACRPYLIGVPANQSDSKMNLANTPITFSASNVAIVSGSDMVTSGKYFKFNGTFEKDTLSNAFILNEDGSEFVNNGTQTTVAPFRAYFSLWRDIDPSNVKQLSVDFLDDDALAITPVYDDGTDHSIFNINGVKVGNSTTDLQRLPKGVYIMNGKKVVR
jgi:hypothetical protein